MDPLRPGLNLRPHLLADGITDSELRGLRRRGDLTTLRPGVYLRGASPDDAAAGHLQAVQAALPRLAADTVVSHASAAVVRGLPLWAVRLDRVHATRDRSSGARRSGILHLHAAALEPDEVVLVDGLLVTSVARTLADLARQLAFEAALVPTDAALHRGLVTQDHLAAALERGAHRRNNAAARRVVAFADGRAESPGETRSRVAIRRGVADTDVAVPGHRHADRLRVGGARDLGEFDGKVKYGRYLRPGQTPGDAVFAEKRREDALRDHGLEVVRWVWDELDTFDAPLARLLRAFARA